MEVKFPRDKEGNFCINSNKYTTSTEKIVKVKYQDEVRLCLGVASVKMPNGLIIGKRAEIIDYTGKVIISEEEENRRIQMEIERVRGISKNSKNKKWKTITYPPGYSSRNIYENDPICFLKQIGSTVCSRLLEKHNLKTIKDLLVLKEKNENEL